MTEIEKEVRKRIGELKIFKSPDDIPRRSFNSRRFKELAPKIRLIRSRNAAENITNSISSEDT